MIILNIGCCYLWILYNKGNGSSSVSSKKKKLEAEKDNKSDSIPTEDVDSHVNTEDMPIEFERVKRALSETMKKKNATPFLTPVDPIKLDIPNYFQIIKKPMDLGTIMV
jgi:hypothetical protein